MISNQEKKNLKRILTETLLMLCKNGLSFKNSFSMEALIGVTLDENDVVLFSLHETISVSSDAVNSTTQKHVEHSSRKSSNENSKIALTRKSEQSSEHFEIPFLPAMTSSATQASQLPSAFQQNSENRLNPQITDVVSMQQLCSCQMNPRIFSIASAIHSESSTLQNHLHRLNEYSQSCNIKNEPSNATTHISSSNWMDECVAGCSSIPKQEPESKYSAEQHNDEDDCILLGDEEQLKEDASEFVEEGAQYEEDDVLNDGEWMEAGDYNNESNYEGTSSDHLTETNVGGFVDGMEAVSQGNHFIVTAKSIWKHAASKTSRDQKRPLSRGGHRSITSHHNQSQGNLHAAADRVLTKMSDEILADIMTQATIQQSFRCPICEKYFTKRAYLTYHVNVVHLQKKRYPCKQCGKTFKWHSGLYNHKRTCICRPGDDPICFNSSGAL